MKSIFKSKVIWANILTIVVTVAAFFNVHVDPTLGEKVATYLIMLNPVINMVLRFFTSQPVTIK